MQVERVKYVIWAADMDRAIRFWCDLFGGRLAKRNQVIAEVEIADAVIGIHSGGEGKRTWTGLSFQVPDVVIGGREVVAAGNALPGAGARERRAGPPRDVRRSRRERVHAHPPARLKPLGPAAATSGVTLSAYCRKFSSKSPASFRAVAS